MDTTALDEFRCQGVRYQGFGWMGFRFLVASGSRPTTVDWIVVELRSKRLK